MNVAKSLIVAVSLNLLTGVAVMAQEKASKSELRAMAVETCHAAAKEKYGDNAIVDSDEFAKVYRDVSRVKWHRSLKGMVLNMKIKPESKRKSKYTCLVKTDRTVTFFKV